MLWKEIIKTATLGTTNKKLEINQVDEFLKPIVENKKIAQESLMLELISAVSFSQKAGFKPSKVDFIEKIDLDFERENETFYPSELIEQFNKIISDGPKELLEELIEALLKGNKVVPTKIIPSLFRSGVNWKLNSEQISKIAGNAGKWLAIQNPEWQLYLNKSDENVWENGTKKDRINHLKKIRKQNIQKSHELWKEVLAEENSKNLVDYLKCFEIGLGVKDEVIMTPLLKHKRKEIRAESIKLIVQIPENELVKRNIKRVNELIKIKSGIGKSLKISLPEKLTNELHSDGISEIKPYGLGEKSSFLYQMIATIPPNYWEDFFNENTHKIFTLAEKSEFFVALFMGFVDASFRHKNSKWAKDLILFYCNKEEKFQNKYKIITNDLIHLVPILNSKDADEFAKFAIKTFNENNVNSAPMGFLSKMNKHGLSLENSLNFVDKWAESHKNKFFKGIDKTPNMTETKLNIWLIVYRLKNYAYLLHPDSIPKIIEKFPDHYDNHLRNQLDKMISILEIRKKIQNINDI